MISPGISEYEGLNIDATTREEGAAREGAGKLR
jgi:hypothetical protein